MKGNELKVFLALIEDKILDFMSYNFQIFKKKFLGLAKFEVEVENLKKS